VFRDNPFPDEPVLIWRRWWQRVDGQSVNGPTKFTIDKTVSEGVSETTSTEVSAELGFAAKGLSAQLSVSFGYSITVVKTNEVHIGFEHTVDKGVICNYATWELIDDVWIYKQGEEDQPYAMYNEQYTLDGGHHWGPCQFAPCGFTDGVFVKSYFGNFPE
jgi:hypothetical protein